MLQSCPLVFSGFYQNLNLNVSIVTHECGFKWQCRVYHLTKNCPSERSGTLCALMCPTERQISVLSKFTQCFLIQSFEKITKNLKKLCGLPLLLTLPLPMLALFFFHPWVCPSLFAEQGRVERQLCDAKRGHQVTENIKLQKMSKRTDAEGTRSICRE